MSLASQSSIGPSGTQAGSGSSGSNNQPFFGMNSSMMSSNANGSNNLSGFGSGSVQGQAGTNSQWMNSNQGQASGSGSGSFPGQGLTRKRSPSPGKGDQERSSKLQKKDANEGFNLRAEEDAARRLNVGRVTTSYSGLNQRGKRSDLFGPGLKNRLDNMAKEHKISFDDESLAYLSMAAETRLRSLLSSALSAQIHRTSTSHLHQPPLSNNNSSKASSSKHPQPLWSVSIQNDDTAIIEALNRQAKDSEQSFRTERMNRIAKEAEIARFREKQAAAQDTESQIREGGANENVTSGTGSSGVVGNETSNDVVPSTPDRPSPSSSTKAGGSGSATATATPSATPVFGGVVKKPKGSKKVREVSSDMAIRQANMTAARSAGLPGRQKYSWLTGNQPAISSPLAGKTKKAKKAKSKLQDNDNADGSSTVQGDGDQDADGEVEGEDIKTGNEKFHGANGEIKQGKKGKKLDGEMQGDNLDKRNGDGSKDVPGNGSGSGSKSKRPKPPKRNPTNIKRRSVLIEKNEKGEEKRVNDDRALTIVDMVFALDKDKFGKGMGTSDEVLRRVMSRSGGVWVNDLREK